MLHRVVHVMIVTPIGGGFSPDFEDLSFKCSGYNKVSNAVKSVRSCLSHDDVASCAFIDNNVVPGCVEAAQKSGRPRDEERMTPWQHVSVRSRELLSRNNVATFRVGEVASRYPSVDEYTSRYGEGVTWGEGCWCFFFAVTVSRKSRHCSSKKQQWLFCC